MTLERAIKFGQTIGCKGCERIAEGVPHTEECHERFHKLLECKCGASQVELNGEQERPSRDLTRCDAMTPGRPDTQWLRSTPRLVNIQKLWKMAIYSGFSHR